MDRQGYSGGKVELSTGGNIMKYQSVYNRLRRIEGQVRGIGEMVANDKSEQELLIQLEAARASLSSAIGSLIEEMLKQDEGGKVILEETQVRALLRSVKKS